MHLLFVGAGELGGELRAASHVVYDADDFNFQLSTFNSHLPPASFAGFLNQTEISSAYVAADCLVLPSDFGETWGLVANEAMASGLPCVISDHCGCAEDLGIITPNQKFPCGDTTALTDRLVLLNGHRPSGTALAEAIGRFSFERTATTVRSQYFDM